MIAVLRFKNEKNYASTIYKSLPADSVAYAPINVNPVGGSAGKGWGFDKF